MKNIGNAKRTKLNLAVTTYIDNYLLPKFLPILFNAAPQIDIATTVLDQYIPQAIEDLISANQGVSYLPVYIVKESCKSKIRLIAPQKIESPISFTYLIWKKESSAIHTFIELFEEFIAKEQENGQ